MQDRESKGLRLKGNRSRNLVSVPGSHAPVSRKSDAKTSRGGRPTKKQSEEIASRILDTAADLFAKQGFSATSMEQIAAECGAGKDTVYRRYSTKAVIFTALMVRLRETIIPELNLAMKAGGSTLERLKNYARIVLSINLRPGFLALNRVALGEAMAFGGVKPVPTNESPVMDRFAKLVEDAQAQGVLADADPFFLAEQLLYATSIKPMISAMIGDQTFIDLSSQDKYFEMAWSQFMAGATPR